MDSESWIPTRCISGVLHRSYIFHFILVQTLGIDTIIRLRTSAPNPNRFPDPSLSLPHRRDFFFFLTPAHFICLVTFRAIPRSRLSATAQMGGKGRRILKCGIREIFRCGISSGQSLQRWPCRFPPGAWLWDHEAPAALRILQLLPRAQGSP